MNPFACHDKYAARTDAMEPHEPLYKYTALACALLGRLWPVRPAVSRAEYDVLRKNNRWIDGVAEALSFLGLVLGIVLPIWIKRSVGPWDIAVQFGMAVLLPVGWIAAATLPSGEARLRQFERWYSGRYGVDARSLFLWIYAPIIALGVVGAFAAYTEF